MGVVDAERVLCVPRSVLPGEARWYGLLREGAAEILQTALPAASFRARAEAETNPAWKQLIPYLVLRDGSRTFLMRRTRRGGDARLYDQYSIGVGGHVNPEDRSLEEALLREWSEEVVAAFQPEVRLLGLLNDDGSEVGAVHLGVVYQADAQGRPVTVGETEKLVGGFAGPEEIRRVQRQMETWSQILVGTLLDEAG